MATQASFDLAIIGGGLAGLIQLHYARQAGLNAVVLEKSEGVGGLWRRLPAWQDIQICPVDWTVGDMPVAGPRQAQILANIETWVTRFGLADGIRLNCPVQRARHTGTCWALDTPQGTLQARHLVAATGGHNTPVTPPVRRGPDAPRDLHSSALSDPTVLAGQRVLVVGGGASALDLLDLCLEHGASHIAWVYRGVRWFTPTQKPKAVAGSVRPIAKMQAQGMSIDQQNALINADLRARYQKFGIQAIQPALPFDIQREQLFPGRARMLAHFADLDRHQGTPQALEHGGLTLSNGEQLATDLVLWGTGYATNLSCFEAPRIAAIRSVAELSSRCACLFRSIDAPDLYFPGVGLDGFGATSWLYAMTAKTIVSHICGTAQLDMVSLAHRLNHLDMVKYLAERDSGTYGHGQGWAYYRDLALNTPDDQPYPMP